MSKICSQMLPKEITDEHEYTSKYHKFHAGQLDNKLLIVPLCKTVKQRRQNDTSKDLLNRPYHFIYKQPLFQI